jgi:ATP-dependent Zn protease
LQIAVAFRDVLADDRLVDDITALAALPTLDGPDLVSVEVTPVAARVLDVWAAEGRITALHDGAGHVTIAALLGLPIKAASVEDRAMGAGHTELGTGSETELQFEHSDRLLDRICCALGGWAAEKVFFPETGPTTGCGDDLVSATALAELRIRSGLAGDEAPFIAPQAMQWGQMPESLKSDIAVAIIATLVAQRERAVELIRAHKTEAEHFAAALFAARRLDRQELDAALAAAGLPVRPRVGAAGG